MPETRSVRYVGPTQRGVVVAGVRVKPGGTVDVPELLAVQLVRQSVWEPDGWTPPSADDVPDGTVDDVTDWVGDDPVRAARALEVERARTRPRSTLIADLENVIAASVGDQPTDDGDAAGIAGQE